MIYKISVVIVLVIFLSFASFNAPSEEHSMEVFSPEWAGLGAKMVEAGVIDEEKFIKLYEARGGLDREALELLSGKGSMEIEFSEDNAEVLLNLFWALGLGTESLILDEGPMRDPKFGGANRFASTGGWTLSEGHSMNHYSRHHFFSLTEDQDELLEGVAKNVYRPCCDNPTYFPDCNHGMAMLGLLSLAASQDATESDLFDLAYVANSHWFPDYYKIIDAALGERDSRMAVGKEFASGSGFKSLEKMGSGGVSCGV